MIRLVLWAVTASRIALIPVFLVMAHGAEAQARGGEGAASLRAAAIAILAGMAVSDVLDGWIARRFGLATPLGALVDALADKLAQVAVAAFLTLGAGAVFHALPLWFLAIVVGRDMILGGGWLILHHRVPQSEATHRWHGRTATVAVFTVFFWACLGLPASALPLLLGAAAAVVALSTMAYAAEARDRWVHRPSP